MSQWQQKEAEELMNAVANGSITAFECFYDHYSALVFRVAMKTIGNRMDAEDVCQDVFMEVMRHRDRFDPNRGSVESWLAVLARSRSLDLIRKSKRRAEQTLDQSPECAWGYTGGGPEETALHHMNNQALHEAVLQLPIGQQKVIFERVRDGLSQREMAKRWQLPLGTIKSQFRYALANLRRHLTAAGWGDEKGGEPSDANS